MRVRTLREILAGLPDDWMVEACFPSDQAVEIVDALVCPHPADPTNGTVILRTATPRPKLEAAHMDIHTPPGTKVVFAYPNAGCELDRKIAQEYLALGRTYTVKRTETLPGQTNVFLVEVPPGRVSRSAIAFNSLMFAPVEGDSHA